MVTPSDDSLSDRSDSDSPTFFDSLSSFKDKFITEAEELFSASTDDVRRPPSRLITSLSDSSFEFSFPWSRTNDPHRASVSSAGDLNGHGNNDSSFNSTDSYSGKVSVPKRPSSCASGILGTYGPAKVKRGGLKRENSIRSTNGTAIENGTLLQFSALNLTIHTIKTGDIPSFPEIIDDLYKLEGANPEQVQIIIDKMESLRLTINSLDKRLEKIDRGLDNLNRKS